MTRPFFSIIVVCLNPGDKLKTTLESIEGQTFGDYEVVIKDGMSSDGSLAYARALAEEKERAGREKGEEGSGRIRILARRDAGIYDAMNQAVEESAGRYLYFLNCGDRLYSSAVLQEMRDFIGGSKKNRGIYYGNIYARETGQVVASNPRMDAFGCYRNVPCHQACFYSRELVRLHPFETGYKVRADYEQFLWCFFAYENRDSIEFAYREMIVADYEGGGFSETKENRRISDREHREITGRYISGGQLFKFRMIMLLTLAPLRTRIAENERTAGIYNRMKKVVYGWKRQ